MKKITKTNYNHHTNKNKIRIIGGKWHGKNIITIQHKKLRPTTNQIRETLFNWLAPVITGANCLDCFAGSGALGLEALSRHAFTVTFLEQNKKISNKLKANIQRFHVQEQTKIITTNTISWLSHQKNNIKPFNIIFLDPPFSKYNHIQNIIKLLEKSKYLSKNSWIYIEHKKNNTNLFTTPNTWKLHKKKVQETYPIKYTLLNKNTNIIK